MKKKSQKNGNDGNEGGADDAPGEPARRTGDGYGKPWIIENSMRLLEEYAGEAITVRQLYYRLVSLGMPNDLNHYKRVVAATTDARWAGDIDFEAFVDRERAMAGETRAEEKDLDAEIEKAEEQVKAWMTAYRLDRWSNQSEYVEVWIEKKALQGVFEMPCLMADVGLFPCKGYPSLTALHEAAERFDDAEGRGQHVLILYFGDYDPSGEDIPRAVAENLARMGHEVEVERVALTAEMVKKLGLPPAPVKVTDSRSRYWSGSGCVELDAVEPRTLRKMVEEAIRQHFDRDKHEELKRREAEEREKYQDALRDFVLSMGEGGEDDDKEGESDGGDDDGDDKR